MQSVKIGVFQIENMPYSIKKRSEFQFRKNDIVKSNLNHEIWKFDIRKKEKPIIYSIFLSLTFITDCEVSVTSKKVKLMKERSRVVYETRRKFDKRRV